MICFSEHSSTKFGKIVYSWYERVPEIVLHWREEAFAWYRKWAGRGSAHQRVTFRKERRRPAGRIVYPTNIGVR